MTHSKSAWTDAIMMQMPRGDIWPREQDSFLYKYVSGYAARLQRAERSANQLLLEMRPESTTNMLEEWETYLSLPECTLSEQKFDARRKAVVEKYRRKGGLQSWAIEELAATLGYTVEVNEIFPHHCLRDCMYPLQPARYRHLLQIRVLGIDNSNANCLDDCMTTLISQSAALLDCTLQKFKLGGKYYEYIYE